jgi:hypothetical protein
MSTAAATIALAGGVAAAYAAVLPAPVQHIAYRVLGKIGVPDTHGPPSASPVPGLTASAPPPAPAPAATACGCRTGGPAGAAAMNLVLAADRTQIPANGDVVFSGLLAPGGRPEPGVVVRLLERVDGHPGWRAVGRAVTDRGGEVSLTVRHLTGNASFRLVAAGGTASLASPPIQVTVIPPVDLYLVRGQLPDLETLTARAWFAEPGDAAELQELSAGVWYQIGKQVISQDHLATFTVLIPASGDLEYRVVIPATIAHGSSVSDQLRVTAPPRARG